MIEAVEIKLSDLFVDRQGNTALRRRYLIRGTDKVAKDNLAAGAIPLAEILRAKGLPQLGEPDREYSSLICRSIANRDSARLDYIFCVFMVSA